jgi:hypothetical protein
MISQSGKVRGSRMRTHLSTSFMLWNQRQTWFWLVLDQHGNGGTIGTAVSEAEAVDDACSSIEEAAVRLPLLATPRVRSNGKASVATLRRPYPCNAAMGWMNWWMSVAHQVTGKMLNGWTDLVVRSS